MNWLLASALAENAGMEAQAASKAFGNMGLMTKGLITTGLGLAGVFLVLFLFFLTIKAMQKIK